MWDYQSQKGKSKPEQSSKTITSSHVGLPVEGKITTGTDSGCQEEKKYVLMWDYRITSCRRGNHNRSRKRGNHNWSTV